MNTVKDVIIEIVEQKSETIFPIGAPDKIADEIIRVFDLDPNASCFIPPKVEEAIDYIVAYGLLDEKTIPQIRSTAEMFVNYYDTVGWKVGKAKKPMKSWKKALNNWCKRDWNKQQTAKVEESIKAHNLIQKQINGNG
jgi:hypothetical protein